MRRVISDFLLQILTLNHSPFPEICLIVTLWPLLPTFLGYASDDGKITWKFCPTGVAGIFQSNYTFPFVVIVQLLIHVQLCNPWTAAHQASLSFTVSWTFCKLIELVMPSNHLILCCPLLLLASVFPSIMVFSNESALHIRWPKCWSFSFSVSPSNEYLGMISFRIDKFDVLAVQRTLESLLQHHFSKASVLGQSAFFMVVNSHIHTWLLEKHSFDCTDYRQWCLCFLICCLG